MPLLLVATAVAVARAIAPLPQAPGHARCYGRIASGVSVFALVRPPRHTMHGR